MRIMRTALAVFAVLSCASTVRADAIMGPPTDCPRGARGESSHSGQWCAPTECTPSHKCRDQYGGETDELSCAQQGLCVETEPYVEGGMRAVGEPPRRLTREVARGVCTSNADCTAPARCVIEPRCVPVTLLEAFSPSNVHCAASPGRGAAAPLAWVLVLGSVGAWFLRRRR